MHEPKARERFRSAVRNGAQILLAGVLMPWSATGQNAAVDPASTTQKPSTLVQPALDSVSRAGSGVDLNKWKGPNALRSEVDANLASMQKDIQSTLPGLLSAADGAPDSAASSLPLLLNLDALYSVLLRISIASRGGAPRDEALSLEQSAVLLDNARRDLGAAILVSAKAQEKRTADLQATLQQHAAAAATVAVQPQPPTAAPAAPKPRRRKPVVKPAAAAAPKTP